jgi:hypothetical protein
MAHVINYTYIILSGSSQVAHKLNVETKLNK